VAAGLGTRSTLLAHAAILALAAATILIVRAPVAAVRRTTWDGSAVWRAIRAPRVALGLVMTALSTAPFQVGYALSQPYVLLVGMPVWLLGPLETARAMTAAVASAASGRVGRPRAASAIVVAQAALVASFVVLGAFVGPAALVFFPVIAAAGAAAFVVQKALLNEIEIAERSTINSAQSFVTTIGVGLSLWTVLAIADHFGLVTALLATGAFFAVTFAAAFVAWRRTGSERVPARRM
jgi:predicted MFS family arabinose efflux permease